MAAVPAASLVSSIRAMIGSVSGITGRLIVSITALVACVGFYVVDLLSLA
jgi:hypothetical protein